MIHLYLCLALGFCVAGLAATLSATAGPLGFALSVGGAALGLCFVPRASARVLAFPREGAVGFALATALAVGVGAFVGGDPLVGLAYLVAGFMAGRTVQSALFWIGVQKIRRLPASAALLIGASAAPLSLAVEPRSAPLVVALVAVVFAVVCRASSAAALDLPAPVREGAFKGIGTLVGAALVGFGYGRLLPGSDVGLLAIGAGALVGALAAGRVRRIGIVFGATSLLAVGLLGALLAEAPALPRLADLDVRVAIAGALLGFGASGLPRFYAGLPAGLKIVGLAEDADREVLDGAVRRAGMLVGGLGFGFVADFAWLTPLVTFGVLALGGALLVWFDPRAGAGRRARVLALSAAAAAFGLYMVRQVPV